MNGHSNHNHVNGQAHRTEEEEAQLDAYQEELVHEAILDEVKTFFAAQEIRVSLYREFETAFRQNVEGEKTDAEMAGVIASSTTSFNEVSQRINRVETALKNDLDRTDIANLIRRVQEFEKQKFEATVKAQMWEKQEGERDFADDIREARRLREEAIDNINEVMDEIRAEVY